MTKFVDEHDYRSPSIEVNVAETLPRNYEGHEKGEERLTEAALVVGKRKEMVCLAISRCATPRSFR